jgi:hypothetical protein
MAGLTALLDEIRMTLKATVWGRFFGRVKAWIQCQLNLRVRGETRV